MFTHDGKHLQTVLNRVVWGLLALTVILSIVTTGISGSAATGFRNNLHCNVPDKLNYNLAVVSFHYLQCTEFAPTNIIT